MIIEWGGIILELIKNPCQELFNTLIANSDKKIALCAPYVKKDIVSQILNLKKNDVELVLITSSNLATFATGGSDISAIKYLVEKGINTYNYQNLHAKVYVFDSDKALITSSNLTYGGLVRNYEYGVYINDEDIIRKINIDYNDMLVSELCGKFDKKSIDYIEKTISGLGSKPNVIIDEEGNVLLSQSNVMEIIKKLAPWQRDVFDLINKLNKVEFTTKDTTTFISVLKNKHPQNNTIEASLRRNLQELRDRGLILFVSKGHYKKLWE